MNSLLFPPNTEEVQFDEKCNFVKKEEKHCKANNLSDARCGDHWDHVALDAEHKLVLEVVNGKRTEANTKQLVKKTAHRLQFKPPRLITSDEHKPYRQAILETFGEKYLPHPTGKRGRPKKARFCTPKDLVYATVHKTRMNGGVVKIDYRTVFGTKEQVQAALSMSRCSHHVNTSFLTSSQKMLKFCMCQYINIINSVYF